MHLFFDEHYIHIGKPLLFLIVFVYSTVIAGLFELINNRNEKQWKDDILSAKLRHEGQVSALIAQNAQLSGITQQYNALNNEQNEIAVFLRDNYDTEISAGYHNTRQFSTVVIGYLKKEREYAKRAG